MSYDTGRAIKWLYDTVAADAGVTGIIGSGRVYRDKIPAQGAIPGIVVSHVGSLPGRRALKSLPGSQEDTRVTAKVKIVTASQYDMVLADAVIAALDGKTYAAMSSGTLYSCVLDNDLEYGEDDGEVHYKHHDLYFRLEAKA